MSSYRKYLKNQVFPGMSEMETDLHKGKPIPPIQKEYDDKADLIDLVPIDECRVPSISLLDSIKNRESRRRYKKIPLKFDELSFLLWCTQGVKSLTRGGLVTLRTVPSGGGMHPFETYLLIFNVEGLKPGLYRYIALGHKLLFIKEITEEYVDEFIKTCNNQRFIIEGNLVFIWTVRPYRTEYRYGEDCLKDILISVGHICQNLYLACEALNVGTCSIIAYQQDNLNLALEIDGNDEIAIYLAPVGKI